MDDLLARIMRQPERSKQHRRHQAFPVAWRHTDLHEAFAPLTHIVQRIANQRMVPRRHPSWIHPLTEANELAPRQFAPDFRTVQFPYRLPQQSSRRVRLTRRADSR